MGHDYVAMLHAVSSSASSYQVAGLADGYLCLNERIRYLHMHVTEALACK